MRKLFILIGLIASSALAETTTTIKADNTEGFVSNRNLVFNANFELTSTTSGAGWALSSGTYSISGTAPLRGSRSAVWDATAASQIFSSKLVAIPAGMQGIGGVASCQIKVASGVATHTLRVTDGTNVLGQIPVVSSSIATVTSVPFMFPISGSVDLELVSNADEPSIQIDDCYLGVNPIEKVAQATMYAYATAAGGASCDFFESTSTGLTNFVDLANTASTCGSWTTSGNISLTTNDYRPTLNNMPPGEYEISVARPYIAASGYISLRLTDGTNTSDPVTFNHTGSGAASNTYMTFRMKFDTAASRTFKLQCADTLSGSCGLSAGAGLNHIWIFKRFPLQAEQVVRADVLQGQWGSRYFPDGTVAFTTTSATYVSVTGANVFAASTNKGAASACSDANALCVRMPQLFPGSYKIDYTGGLGAQTGGTACSIAVSDGATDYEFGGGYVGATTTGYSGSTVVSFSSIQTNKEFTVRVKRNLGGGSCDILTSANVGHNLTITPLSQQLPVPVFVGSVVSATSGTERIERIRVTAAGAIIDKSSDWITSAPTVSGGLFTYAINGGYFSGDPTCVCAPNLNSTGAGCQMFAGISSTQIRTQTYNAAGSAVAFAHDVICMGPRP